MPQASFGCRSEARDNPFDNVKHWFLSNSSLVFDNASQAKVNLKLTKMTDSKFMRILTLLCFGTATGVASGGLVCFGGFELWQVALVYSASGASAILLLGFVIAVVSDQS